MFVKKKLRREDFLLESGWFEELVRKPGELHMQQFQISDCEECTICLFDTAACVYIDQCKYCLVFVGACEASVFVRDCVHTTVVCATQQFRVRDCLNCHFSLSCESQPVIESSRGITISNFPLLAYHSMEQHMAQARITPWNNNWFDIFDFTPNKFNTQNYSLAPLGPQKQKEVTRAIQDQIQKAELQLDHPLIPRVIGPRDHTVEEFAVLVAHPVPPPIASEDMPLLQSRVHMVTAEEVRELGVEGLSFEGRTKVLFAKVLRKELGRWRGSIQNVLLEVVERERLQLYEGVIFAPFKDDH